SEAGSSENQSKELVSLVWARPGSWAPGNSVCSDPLAPPGSVVTAAPALSAHPLSSAVLAWLVRATRRPAFSASQARLPLLWRALAGDTAVLKPAELSG